MYYILFYSCFSPVSMSAKGTLETLGLTNSFYINVDSKSVRNTIIKDTIYSIREVPALLHIYDDDSVDVIVGNSVQQWFEEQIKQSQTPVQQQTPIQPLQQTPVQQAPVQQAPVQQTPIQQTPIQQTPIQPLQQQTPIQPLQQQTPIQPLQQQNNLPIKGNSNDIMEQARQLEIEFKETMESSAKR